MKLERNFVINKFSKTISDANGNHDNYQRILSSYPYNALLGFRWFPNGWKLEPKKSTPTVSFEQMFLDKVKPIQEH